jgi:hypothetical protein
LSVRSSAEAGRRGRIGEIAEWSGTGADGWAPARRSRLPDPAHRDTGELPLSSIFSPIVGGGGAGTALMPHLPESIA